MGEALIPLIGIVATVLLNAAGYLVAWGVLQGTVKALGERVTALEAEVAAVTDLKLQVVRVETRLDALVEQIKDLNASIRWMRSVPEYEPPPLPSGAVGARRAR